MKTLGKKIKLLRHQKSWNQEDMAKRLDISIPAFSKIETGITDVNLSRLEQISSLFGMDVVELLNYNEDSKGPQSKSTEMEALVEKVKKYESEIVQLQRKLIDLYESKEPKR